MPTKINKTKMTGTREWAKSNINIQFGCEHNCRYCYARYDAVHRFKHCTADQWVNPVIDWHKASKTYHKRNGTIMFPSTHDITPANLQACELLLSRLLRVGNEILVVSKPHFECIKRICDRFSDCKDLITFRFTIGSANDDVLNFWEPNAPGFLERISCLDYAYSNGFETSVSCEPFLNGEISFLYQIAQPFITKSFWIGKLRDFDRRVDLMDITSEQMDKYVKPLKFAQTDTFICALYEQLNGQPFIKWKDSIRVIMNSH